MVEFPLKIFYHYSMLKLFSGSAHPTLARFVAQELDVELSRAEVVRFDNSEARVRIEENVLDMPVAVIQPISNPTDQNVMELLFFADALRRSGASHITAIIPYFGYARQDIQHRAGECVSFTVVVSMLEHIGFNEIITIDLHDEASRGVFTVPFTHVSALPVLADAVREYIGKDSDLVAIVSADHSGIERARTFGKAYFNHEHFDIVVAEKQRDLSKIHESKATELYGDVQGKIALVVDDIATSGKTLVNAAHLCLANGAIRAIGAVVHHDFHEGAGDFIEHSKLEVLFTTNTIPLQTPPSKHIITDCSSLLADAIKHKAR